MILSFAGNPSVDKTLLVDSLAVGEINRPTDFVQVPGGRGLNAARAARTLGGDVLVSGFVGGFAGRWIAAELERRGVKCEFVAGPVETRARLTVIDAASGRMTGFSEVPRPIAAADWDHLERTLETLIDKSTWVALAGSLPPGAPDDAYARLVNAVHRVGGGVVVDTQGAHLAEAIAAKPDIVKVSVAEAAELLGATLSDTPAEALGAAREIRRRGAPTPTGHFPCVVITFRGRGALALTPDDSGIVIEPVAIGPYRAGSGDAFLAGMLVALDRDDGWADVFRLAAGAAAANAEMPGAGRLDAGRARELASAARLKHV
jgi:1-phosphofructokinase family hexose kinase